MIFEIWFLATISSDNEVKIFSKNISIEELKLIINKEEILHKCFDRIASKDIAELTPFLSEEYRTYFLENEGEIAIKNINQVIGKYKVSMFRGYEITTNELTPDKQFIMLNGLMLGTIQNVDINIIIDPEKPNNKSVVALDIISSD